MDEQDESPNEEMNVIRGTEGERWRLGASTCSGGFAEVAEEDPVGVCECWSEGAMLCAISSAHSVNSR